jgi:hypothetical protein
VLDDDLDQPERILCPDDSCIGVLGPDGVCPECGAIGDQRAADDSTADAQGLDLFHRQLCPDGSCIGVIGPDGRCRECGRVSDDITTDPRLRGLQEEEDSEEELLPAADALGDDFAERRLCPDGACIGVIGPEGNCNECGRAA